MASDDEVRELPEHIPAVLKGWSEGSLDANDSLLRDYVGKTIDALTTAQARNAELEARRPGQALEWFDALVNIAKMVGGLRDGTVGYAQETQTVIRDRLAADAARIRDLEAQLERQRPVIEAARQVADLYSGPAKYPTIEYLAETLDALDAPPRDGPTDPR